MYVCKEYMYDKFDIEKLKIKREGHQNKCDSEATALPFPVIE